jgi:hypothetical protein
LPGQCRRAESRSRWFGLGVIRRHLLLRLTDLPTNTGIAVLAIGASIASWNSTPLPFHLDGPAPGCWLLVAVDRGLMVLPHPGQSLARLSHSVHVYVHFLPPAASRRTRRAAAGCVVRRCAPRAK